MKRLFALMSVLYLACMLAPAFGQVTQAPVPVVITDGHQDVKPKKPGNGLHQAQGCSFSFVGDGVSNQIVVNANNYPARCGFAGNNFVVPDLCDPTFISTIGTTDPISGQLIGGTLSCDSQGHITFNFTPVPPPAGSQTIANFMIYFASGH